MSKYKYIAFDLDGTLSDPENGLIEGFIYAFKKMGVADYGARESLRRFIGPSLYKVWQEEFGFNEHTVIDAIEKFREYYNIYGWWDNKVYDGVRETLEGLRKAGKRLILATSKPDDTAKKIMEHFDLARYFDFVGGAEGDNRDHKWQVLEYSMQSVGASAAETVMVGDRMYDAEGAKICGVDSIGVAWGHGTEEELENAGFTHIVKTPEEPLEYLIKE